MSVGVVVVRTVAVEELLPPVVEAVHEGWEGHVEGKVFFQKLKFGTLGLTSSKSFQQRPLSRDSHWPVLKHTCQGVCSLCAFGNY